MNQATKANWCKWAEDAVADANAKAARRSQQVPLLPRHGIHLLSMDGDGRRFARLFRRAWVRLPCSSRRRLLERWRGRQRLFASLLDDIGPWKCCLPLSVAWIDGLCDQAVERMLMCELTTAAGDESEVNL